MKHVETRVVLQYGAAGTPFGGYGRTGARK